MDSLTFLGIVIAAAALFFGQTLEGGHFSSLLNLPALLIVVGGSLGAIMLQTSLQAFSRSMVMFGWILFPPEIDWKLSVKKTVAWSEIARREGILGLEKIVAREQDPFIKKGLQLLVDGREPATIRQVLEIEIDTHEIFDLEAAKIYESMGGYTPTLGILGAVMGLIHVMENLSDPTNLGQGIATAFVATIYGVGLANLFLIPASRKLQTLVRQQSKEKDMIVEGLVLIAQGENPRNIGLRLQAYDRSL